LGSAAALEHRDTGHYLTTNQGGNGLTHLALFAGRGSYGCLPSTSEIDTPWAGERLPSSAIDVNGGAILDCRVHAVPCFRPGPREAKFPGGGSKLEQSNWRKPPPPLKIHLFHRRDPKAPPQKWTKCPGKFQTRGPLPPGKVRWIPAGPEQVDGPGTGNPPPTLTPLLRTSKQSYLEDSSKSSKCHAANETMGPHCSLGAIYPYRVPEE